MYIACLELARSRSDVILFMGNGHKAQLDSDTFLVVAESAKISKCLLVGNTVIFCIVLFCFKKHEHKLDTAKMSRWAGDF